MNSNISNAYSLHKNRLSLKTSLQAAIKLFVAGSLAAWRLVKNIVN